jgi:hypothetical protein
MPTKAKLDKGSFIDDNVQFDLKLRLSNIFSRSTNFLDIVGNMYRRSFHTYFRVHIIREKYPLVIQTLSFSHLLWACEISSMLCLRFMFGKCISIVFLMALITLSSHSKSCGRLRYVPVMAQVVGWENPNPTKELLEHKPNLH